MSPPEQLGQIRERVEGALRSYTRLTGHVPPRFGRASDASTLRLVIDEATQGLTHWAGADTTRGGLIKELLHELSMLSVGLQGHEVLRRRESVTRMHASLQRLQQHDSSKQLSEAIPLEVASLGFNRVLFSWVDQARWIPESFHTANGPSEARAVMEAGSPPYWHVGRLLEREMVHRRLPMLVRDALDNPRVHLDIQAVMQSTSYVAAPVIQRSRVVAFLHADQNVESGDVDEIDRDVMLLFAEGVSLALDRVSALEELASIRARIGAQAAALTELVTSLGAPGGEDVSTPKGEPARVSTPNWSAVLTRREEQVLGYVATGLSNAQIADRMYITEGTAKTHVKNVLRKLGAENRAHAGAMYRDAQG